MTIQLTVPALERLIGGDTEVEVELRKQIVMEFTRRHLKEVATEETWKAVLAEVAVHINAVVKEQIGVEQVLGRHWSSISDRLKSMVENHVKASVETAFAAVIANQKAFWASEIRKALDREINRNIEREVQKRVLQILDAAKGIATGEVEKAK